MNKKNKAPQTMMKLNHIALWQFCRTVASDNVKGFDNKHIPIHMSNASAMMSRAEKLLNIEASTETIISVPKDWKETILNELSLKRAKSQYYIDQMRKERQERKAK